MYEANYYLLCSADLNIYFQLGNAEVLNLEDRADTGGGDNSYRYNRATQWQPQSIDGIYLHLLWFSADGRMSRALIFWNL